MSYKITIEHSDDETEPCTWSATDGGQTDFEAALFFALRRAVRGESTDSGDRQMLKLLALVICECAEWFDEPRADDIAAFIDSAINFTEDATSPTPPPGGITRE